MLLYASSIPLLFKLALLVSDAVCMRISGRPPNPPTSSGSVVIPDWREHFLKRLAYPSKALRVCASFFKLVVPSSCPKTDNVVACSIHRVRGDCSILQPPWTDLCCTPENPGRRRVLHRKTSFDALNHDGEHTQPCRDNTSSPVLPHPRSPVYL